jgi:HlyD family secretion protein
MKKWTWIAIAIVVLIIAAGWLLAKLTGNPAEIATAQPEFRDIVEKTVVTGSVEPNQEVEIKSTVSGIVDELFAGTGDVVKRGDKLARIRIVPEPEQVNEAESGVERARINYRRARADYERLKKLFADDVISRVEYQRARDDYDIRREELSAAENRLEIVRKGATMHMEETTNIITSTMDGMIMNVPVRVGSSIMGRSTFNEGTTIMVVADMENMVFQGDVGESDVARLRPGMELKLTVGALPHQQYDAVLGFISPRGQKEEGIVRYGISAGIQVPDDHLLRAGFSASAEIVFERRDSILSVRERHLKFEDGKPYLKVINEKEEPERRFIKTGISDGLYIEILDGIQAEESFIVDRPERIVTAP